MQTRNEIPANEFKDENFMDTKLNPSKITLFMDCLVTIAETVCI